MSATTGRETAAPAAPIVLTAEAIQGLPLEALDESIDGVAHRVLWRSQTSMAGVMTVAAGRRLGEHAHRVNHHHLWVVAGKVVVLGAELGAGAYVHIPAGVRHDLDARTTDGCTVFYLYAAPDERSTT